MDAGERLLAAVEALTAEVKGLREERLADRADRDTLAHKRKVEAERKARQRASRDGHGTEAETGDHGPVSHTSDVTGQSRDKSRDSHGTPQVLKALVVGDLDLTTRTRSKNLRSHGTVTGQVASHGTEEERPTVATRKAYVAAFQNRWGVDPVIGAKGNGILKHFVALVGQDVAPEVAAFYLSHNQALYVNAKHPLELLQRDANKIHTEWKTNSPSTMTEAKSKERTEANFNGWNKHLSTAKGSS